MFRIIAIVLALAPPEPAAEIDDSPAQAIREGRYADAAEAFAKQFEQTGDPALLFGQAQALRRAGDCKAAIAAFERFIATAPPEPDIAAASAAIDECRDILGVTDEPVPEPAPQPLAPAPDPAPSRRWFADPAGGALVGIGVAIAATGAGLFGASYARLADRPGSEAEYEERRRNVRAMWGTGIGLLASGGVLIVAGAIRWGLVARANKRARAPLVSLGADGFALRF